jgi:predicted acyltransferase
VIGLRFWAFPFVVLGMNAIFIYMVNSVLGFRRFSDPLVGGLANNVESWFGGPYKEALLAVAAFAVAWLILFYMYRKKTFLKV